MAMLWLHVRNANWLLVGSCKGETPLWRGFSLPVRRGCVRGATSSFARRSSAAVVTHPLRPNPSNAEAARGQCEKLSSSGAPTGTADAPT